MLSTQNILSLDQGKLFPHDKTEGAFYARFARETPAPEDREHWHFMGFEFLPPSWLRQTETE